MLCLLPGGTHRAVTALRKVIANLQRRSEAVEISQIFYSKVTHLFADRMDWDYVYLFYTENVSFRSG
jgi:hypothetical protein